MLVTVPLRFSAAESGSSGVHSGKSITAVPNAPRSIEERFLRCAARLVRYERTRKKKPRRYGRNDKGLGARVGGDVS